MRPAQLHKVLKKEFESVEQGHHTPVMLWGAPGVGKSELIRQIAEENNVPPFVIFHDATLSEMMERQPANNEQFLQLNGVGESKLEKYAAAFLKVVSEHVNNEKQDVTDTVSESLLLFRSGLNVDTIASQRNIKTTTVYSHLASCIEQGELKLNQVIDLNQQEINIIHEALLSVDDGSRKLKPVYDALDGMFDYHTLRCVQAAVIPG